MMTDTKNNNASHKLLTYALDKDNSLVFVDNVPNGLACECVCPCCKESLIARNKGKKREHHFAHSSGCNCSGYYETTLHLLSKEIIKTRKAIMLPAYKMLEPRRIEFEEVEVEERNDCTHLQPDCVGITKEGLRLHIEIFVTNPIDDYKKSKIKENNINCIEIRIPRDFPIDENKLRLHIENSTDSREWINYPYGDQLCSEQQMEQIIEYRSLHPELRELLAEKCKDCMVCRGTMQKKYDDFINSYKGRILSWAIPFSRMSPQDIVNHDISLRYLVKSNIPYIFYNERDYWIFPKVGENITDAQKIICQSTYDFFSKLYDLCLKYVKCMNKSQRCEYDMAHFEYQDRRIVFCSYKP